MKVLEILTNFFFFGLTFFESDDILTVPSSILSLSSNVLESSDSASFVSEALSSVFSSVDLELTESLFSKVSPLTLVFLSIASLVGSLRATD